MLEADKIAHRLIEPGQRPTRSGARLWTRNPHAGWPGGSPEAWGHRVCRPGAPRALERHRAPRVLDTQDRELDAIERAEPRAIAVVEAALLIEAGYAPKLDCLVVTWCTPEQQLARLTRQDVVAGAGRGLTLEQAGSASPRRCRAKKNAVWPMK